MGRLMDSILAAVGYKPSDRVQLTHEPENKDKPLPKDAIDKAASISFPYSLPVPSSQTPAQSEPTAPTAADTGDNKEGEIVDCISCRIIGGSTLIGTGAYTYYWANRIAMTQTKTRRRIYRIQGAMFASIFVILGMARFTSFSLFDPTKRHYSVADHLQEEITAIFGFFDKKPPELLQFSNPRPELPGGAATHK